MHLSAFCCDQSHINGNIRELGNPFVFCVSNDDDEVWVLLTKCNPKRFLLTKCGPYNVKCGPCTFWRHNYYNVVSYVHIPLYLPCNFFLNFLNEAPFNFWLEQSVCEHREASPLQLFGTMRLIENIF